MKLERLINKLRKNDTVNNNPTSNSKYIEGLGIILDTEHLLMLQDSNISIIISKNRDPRLSQADIWYTLPSYEHATYGVILDYAGLREMEEATWMK